MKVIEDVQDKHGNYCIIFKSTNLRLIYDWLHTHTTAETASSLQS